MKLMRYVLLTSLLFASMLSWAEIVVKDQGVSMTKEELQFVVKNWTPDMQKAAANDPGDRLELLNLALSNKKIAAQADTVAASTARSVYWEYVLKLRNMQREFVVSHYLTNLQYPDMSDLAAERYETQKEKYAFVPEERLVSHILVMCIPGSCDRKERRPEAETILAKLKAGEDFTALVGQYSEDAGTAAKGGRFDRWMTLGMQGVDPHFLGGAFEISSVGDHSDLVETQFGFHIIRLDELRPAYYRLFDEVRIDIVTALRSEYAELAAKDFDAQYLISSEAVIDEAALEEVFAPYRGSPVVTPQAAGQVEGPLSEAITVDKTGQ